MQRPQVIASLVAATLVASAAGGMAFAKDSNSDMNAAAALKGATISLSDAIAKAEQAVGGKAVEADLDDEQSGARFEVGVLANGKVSTVFVDAKTGDIVTQGTDESEENERSER